MKLEDVKVTDLFAQKQIEKHLDNPELGGMATTQEVASFPKVDKNVDATQERQGLTWKTTTNDNKEIVYGSGNFDEAEQLKTVHTKTERGERGQLHQEINDRNFHNSDEKIIPQTKEEWNKNLTDWFGNYNPLSRSPVSYIITKLLELKS